MSAEELVLKTIERAARDATDRDPDHAASGWSWFFSDQYRTWIELLGLPGDTLPLEIEQIPYEIRLHYADRLLRQVLIDETTIQDA